MDDVQKRNLPRILHPYTNETNTNHAHFTNSLNTHIQFNNGCLGGLWQDTRPLMACWVGTKVCVSFLCWCVCVCVVVKSTLATVRLSISPVWQSWKKLLFGGQSHPTLIKGAARKRKGRDGRGAEVNGGGGGHEEFAHTSNMLSPVLFSPVTSRVSPFVFFGP